MNIETLPVLLTAIFPMSRIVFGIQYLLVDNKYLWIEWMMNVEIMTTKINILIEMKFNKKGTLNIADLCDQV